MTVAQPVSFSDLPTLGLPQEAYTSTEIFELELERIFARQWQYVGHISEWDAPGSFRRLTLGRHDVLLVKDRSGSINGLRNICRHRGAQLVAESEGNCGRTISCPYHGWAFGHDGALVGAPKMDLEREFDKSGYSLKSVAVEIWNGLVFVCLADEGSSPLPVAKILERVTAELPYDLSSARLVMSEPVKVRANWKVTWENGLECYHCAINHPALAKSIDVTAGYRVREGEVLDEPFNWFEFPLRDDAEVPPEDYTNKAPFETSSTAMKSLTWHSAAWELTMTPDGAGMLHHIPVSPTETLVVTHMFLPEHAREGIDYHPDKLFEVSRQTREEDDALCEKVQRGIEAVGYVPGPYNDWYEFEIRRFHRVYNAMMSDELSGPPALARRSEAVL